MEKNKIYIASTILVVFIILLLISLYTRDPFDITENVVEKTFEITDEVKGTSAIIYDITEGKVLAGKNEFNPIPIASVTKLISALIAYEYLNEEDISQIIAEDFLILANTNLRNGDKWKSTDLLRYSLITSSNRGINSISRTIKEKTGKRLVDLMNEFIKKNGLVSTHFVNSTGLDAHVGLSGSESSAYEIALLSEIFFKKEPELAYETTKASETFYSLSGVKYDAINTNILLGSIENPYLSKTGFTTKAGGTLVIIIEIEKDHLLSLVVLNSTKQDRFSDIENLIDLSKELINL